MADTIPFYSLKFQHDQIKQALIDGFSQVLDRNQFILGPHLRQFENDFASYIGMPHCLGVGNGLDALTIALKSLNLPPDTEVIVSAHTFIATWLSILRAGLIPVPIDADSLTFNIDTEKIQDGITEKTAVLLVVHMYGQACNMTRILEICSQHRLVLVEDFAQSHGAMWLQKKTGGFGTVNATSFYPTKNLGALGDGGAITTGEDEVAEYIKRDRNYGFIEKGKAIQPGFNSRLDELQAYFLGQKLLFLDQWNQKRRTLADIYLESLNGIGDLVLPLSDKEAFHVYHLFVVRTAHRDALKKMLADEGIETIIHYPVPLHLQPVFLPLGFREGDFPLAEAIAQQALSLPLWPGMTEEMVGRICSAIKNFFGRKGYQS